MNPSYRLFVDIQLTKPISTETTYLRYVTILPFVPMEGQKIRLTSIDESTTLDIELESVMYDSAEGVFMADIVDDTIVQNYSEDGTLREAEVIAGYTPFGFQRLNYPQGVGHE
jgi:hypothetical protein